MVMVASSCLGFGRLLLLRSEGEGNSLNKLSMRPGRRAGKPPRWPVCTILLAYSISSPQSNAFVWTPEKKTTRLRSYYLVHSSSVSLARQRNNAGRITSSCTDSISLINRPQVSSSQLHASAAISVVEVAARAQEGVVLADYAPAAASLFSNMKLPSAVLTAGERKAREE